MCCHPLLLRLPRPWACSHWGLRQRCPRPMPMGKHPRQPQHPRRPFCSPCQKTVCFRCWAVAWVAAGRRPWAPAPIDRRMRCWNHHCPSPQRTSPTACALLVPQIPPTRVIHAGEKGATRRKSSRWASHPRPTAVRTSGFGAIAAGSEFFMSVCLGPLSVLACDATSSGLFSSGIVAIACAKDKLHVVRTRGSTHFSYL